MILDLHVRTNKEVFLCLVVKETEIEKQLKEEKKILESIAEKTGIYTCIITVVTVLYIHVCMSYNVEEYRY